MEWGIDRPGLDYNNFDLPEMEGHMKNAKICFIFWFYCVLYGFQGVPFQGR